LVNHRLHQATKKGARVFVVNPARFDFNYKLAGETIVAPQALVDAMLGLAKAAVEAGATAPASLAGALDSARSGQGDGGVIAALKAGTSAVILGEAAATHPQASWLRAIAHFIGEATGAGVEAPHDFADGAAALKALRGADKVVAFSAFGGAALREVADVILPIALLAE